MQENQRVKSKNAAKDAFWNEVKRVSLASEAAKDGHTGIHYDVIAKATAPGRYDVFLTVLRDAGGGERNVLHICLPYSENGLKEFLIAFCGFERFLRCPLSERGCFFKEVVPEESEPADSLVRLVLEVILNLHSRFSEAKRIWEAVAEQASTGLGVEIPLWEQLVGKGLKLPS